MISLEDFSDLLKTLYATPLHQEQWGHFLDQLCTHTGSSTGLLLCANSQAQLSIQAVGGRPLDLAIVEAYGSEYSVKDPLRYQLVRSGKLGRVDCEQLMPAEEMMQSEMFQHLIAPLGFRYPSLVAFTCSLRRFEAISFWRTPDEGPMSTDGDRLLELLVPHVQSALEIRHALGVGHQHLASVQTMADASPTATFFLGPDGRTTHSNEAAKAMLRRRDGLTETNGILRATDPDSREDLRRLIRSAQLEGCARYASSPPKAHSLSRGVGRKPLQLLASPVPEERGAGPGAAVLLLVTDPERPVQVNDDLMRQSYGLTPAEIEVANGLLTGYSLEEIAAVRRVSVGTVRQQVKAILGKTGATRQSDLARLLLNLPRLVEMDA